MIIHVWKSMELCELDGLFGIFVSRCRLPGLRVRVFYLLVLQSWEGHLNTVPEPPYLRNRTTHRGVLYLLKGCYEK